MMNPFDARERRWWNKLRCGGTQESADAAFALSVLLCNRGREDEAEAILSQFSIHSDDSIAAPAALRLAQLIERGAGPAVAESAYEAAAARASARAGTAVLIDLAARWMARGDALRARRAYEAIITESHDPSLRAVAGYRLGGIEREAGLPDEAVRRWECALDDASGALYVHLAVNLAEALQEASNPDLDRAEVLLEEAINSDHPDLGPRAAIGLAKLKRRHGQLIDCYRLAQLVVDSQHPVFAPEGAAERDRLVEQELDSLLKLPALTCEQLQLGEGSESDRRQHALYLPITSHSLISDAEASFYRCCEQFDDPLSASKQQCDLRREWPEIDRPEPNGRMAGTFLWRAVLGCLDQGDLRTMRQAIQGENVRIVKDRPYGGRCETWSDRQRPHHIGINSWVAKDDEFELLIVLRTAAWLRQQTSPGGEGLAPLRFRFVFDQASARLMKLLSRGQNDKRLQADPSGIVLLRPEGDAEKGTAPPQEELELAVTSKNKVVDLADFYALA